MIQDPLINAVLKFWSLNEKDLKELQNLKDIPLTHKEFNVFLKNASKLMIAGDYDCDGVCATSIAYLMAEKCSLPVGYYIPNRLKEGYGLSKEIVAMSYEKGYRDLLLVDNGVKAQEAILYALELGMNVAVVDHHLIEDDLLPNVTWVHPNLLDPYFSNMSAGGLMGSLAEGMGLDDPYIHALAALSTVADVMPLRNKNRVLVQKGLSSLNKHRFLQFDSLNTQRYFNEYTAKTLAFQISPKINSIGRMADLVNINTAVQYFITRDEKTILNYASQVKKLNNYRKNASKHLEDYAKSMIMDEPIQIISSTSEIFHEGLLGIAANKISATTQKPCILLREYEEIYKGSARSHTHSLDEIFSKLDSKYFEAMGGHDFAFGMTIKKQYFEEFRERVIEEVIQMPYEDKGFDGIDIDVSWVNQHSLKLLKKFEPFGEGLKLPSVRFLIPKDFKLYSMNGYGYKYVFENSSISQALYFNSSAKYQELLQAKYMIAQLDLENINKIQVFIEAVF